MDNFLQTHIPLANKNNPILISKGYRTQDDLFDMRLKKEAIENIIYNLQNTNNIRLKTHHLRDIHEKFTGDYNFKLSKNSLEFNVYNTKDKFIDNSIYIRVQEIIKDQLIAPSIYDYDYEEKYDLMTINVNNYIDICIYDYHDYFKCNIIIKKPVNIDLLNTIIKALL